MFSAENILALEPLAANVVQIWDQFANVRLEFVEVFHILHPRSWKKAVSFGPLHDENECH